VNSEVNSRIRFEFFHEQHGSSYSTMVDTITRSAVQRNYSSQGGLYIEITKKSSLNWKKKEYKVLR